MNSIILEARHIVKHFPPNVVALADGNLSVARGEVHCLLGANGAGKSTLLKIIAGAYRQDSGSLQFDGTPCAFKNPHEAAKAGIAIIYQELDLIPQLTVAENLFLGHAPARFGIIAKRVRMKRAKAVLEKLNARVRPTDVVGTLSIAGQQLTAIARSLTLDAKIIIMDEPSTALTEQELARVFETIRELVKDGRSILYVSHRLQEVMEIGHRATVMRDGRTVQEFELSEVKEQDLIVAMVGQHRSLIERMSRKSLSKEVAFQVDSLEGPEGVQVKNFSIRCGEIVGLAGLSGSGRTTFLRVIFGDLKGQCRAKLFGKPYSPTSSRYAIARQIGLVPENRKTEGLLLDASLYRNSTLPSLRGRWLVTRQRLVSMTAPILRDLGTKFSAIGQPVRQLSGGNQQKVVLSKWLITRSRFLLLDEPSRGLDVAAKADLYKVVRELAEGGLAVLVASSELDELYANCDRILVFHEGRAGEVFNPNEHTREEILHATITGERREKS
jgi:ribose transport system ATP-binding protein